MKNNTIKDSIFLKKKLEREFKFLRKSRQNNVAGVWSFRARQPGPNLGITINTHGNEPSGLAVSLYLRNYFNLEKNLRKGSVTIVLNNLKATERYFKATNKDEKRRARFCDTNLNRLPANLMKIKNSHSYEIKRAQELKNIWKKFDVGLDIHSTSLPSEPMIIACNKIKNNLIKGFPVRVIVSNIENIQIGKPVSSFYGHKKTDKIEIEAGSHEEKKSFQTAIDCSLALMANLGLIEKKISNKKTSYDQYYVCDSVLFPHTGFELVKIFKTFEKISKGQILARYKDQTIRAENGGHTIFCAGKKSTNPKDEVLFIAKPKTRIQI